MRITDRIARNHFDNGNEYFRIGRYADAAREFEHAFEIAHQNELLYNIAWAYETAGDLATAMSWYERFEQAGAPGMDRDVLRQRMNNLRARLPVAGASASPSPSPEPPPASPAPVASPVPPPTTYRYRQTTLNTVGPFALMGVGIVLGAVGIWQGAAWSGDNLAVSAANNGTRPWSVELGSAYARVGREGTAAWACGGLGVAAIVSGIVWLVARGPGERVFGTAVAFVPTADGAMLSIGGAM